MLKKYFILLAPDAPAGGSAKETPEQIIARLTTENNLLKSQLDEATEAAAERSQEEIEIRKKLANGLTREQAIAVIRRQKEHDAALAQRQAQRLPRLKEIIKTSKSDLTAARRQARIEFQDLEGSEWAAAVTAAAAK